MPLSYSKDEVPKIAADIPLLIFMLYVDGESIFFRIHDQHQVLRERFAFSCPETGMGIKISVNPSIPDSSTVYLRGDNPERDFITCYYASSEPEQMKNSLLETLWRLCQEFREEKEDLGSIFGVYDIYQF